VGTCAARNVVASVLIVATAMVGVATIAVAVRTRRWEGLEAGFRDFLVAAAVCCVAWAAVLTGGLLATSRVWPWRATVATFLLVAAGSGWACVDTALRVDDGFAPSRHLAAPFALFALSVTIVGLCREPLSRGHRSAARGVYNGDGNSARRSSGS
jgi:hypothetical protein